MPPHVVERRTHRRRPAHLPPPSSAERPVPVPKRSRDPSGRTGPAGGDPRPRRVGAPAGPAPPPGPLPTRARSAASCWPASRPSSAAAPPASAPRRCTSARTCSTESWMSRARRSRSRLAASTSMTRWRSASTSAASLARWPTTHAGQQQEHHAVEHHAERRAAHQREVAAGHDQGGDRARSPAVPNGPGQDGPASQVAVTGGAPCPGGLRVLQQRGAHQQADGDREVGAQQQPGATFGPRVGDGGDDRPYRHHRDDRPRPVRPRVFGAVDDGNPQRGVAEAGEPEDRDRPPQRLGTPALGPLLGPLRRGCHCHSHKATESTASAPAFRLVVKAAGPRLVSGGLAGASQRTRVSRRHSWRSGGRRPWTCAGRSGVVSDSRRQ